MPQQRKYNTNAARQEAYRARRERARQVALTAKGLPSLPSIASIPGWTRWNASFTAAHALIADSLSEMQELLRRSLADLAGERARRGAPGTDRFGEDRPRRSGRTDPIRMPRYMARSLRQELTVPVGPKFAIETHDKETLMLLHPTLDKLKALRLEGMLAGLADQEALPEVEALSFEERLGLLVDRELTNRQNHKLKIRIGKAKLRQEAALEDLDFRAGRNLDRSQILALSSCSWLRRHENCILTGSTGVGKSFLSCALANKACREGYDVLYFRVPRLFGELAQAKADGSYTRKLYTMARCDLLVLDDWGIAPFTDEQRRDMLEILDDRYGRRSTLVAAQVPIEKWHEVIADPTLADAILDRLLHNAYKIPMKGESMRKLRGGLTSDPSVQP